jgi:ATP-dependent helicase/nuclease subunit B
MNVHTLPASTPFLECFAKSLLAGEIIQGFPHPQDPFSLAKATIYLPHRRACRNLREVFAKLATQPMLLPRIRPLGEEDGEEESDERPESMDSTARLITLAQLILYWRERVSLATLYLDEDTPLLIAASPYEALALAQKLAELLDQIETEQVPFDNLKRIDLEGKHDSYWQMTLDFLTIITQSWPHHLKEKNLISAAQKRDNSLKLTAEHFALTNAPVIIAGSTGSIRATRDLLKTIATLPKGAVVLPALDKALDEDSFEVLTHAHPQYGLKRLIQHIGVSRKEGGVNELTPCQNNAREQLLSEILRPIETTPLWANLHATNFAKALEGLSLIEASHDASEALSIACLVREKLEDPNETIAIITPDRAKARLIATELSRFKIDVDDSGGIPLLETQEGIYFSLLLSLYTQAFEPCLYASFLAHPLNPHRLEGEDFALKDAELRGFHVKPIEFKGFSNETLGLSAWVEKLKPLCLHLPLILQPLEKLSSQEAENFMLSLSDVQPCVTQLLSGETLRQPASANARVRILGLPESRLSLARSYILCGLNEGIWPPSPQSDPWLNRAMRTQMGLDPQERRIGLAAHDFYMLMGHQNVTLSYALKNGTSPALPSRFLQRLKVVIGEENFVLLKTKGKVYLDYAALIDKQMTLPSFKRPMPCPPLEMRPKKLTVTELTALVRDPYEIYAKHILKLKPLESYDNAIGARERGTLIHKILQKYTQKGGDILAIGQDEFAPFAHLPDVRHFWWPRFERVAKAFLDFEAERSYTKIYAEQSGEWVISLNSGRNFTLKTRADRLERQEQGSFALIDYKTGKAPSQKMRDSNFSPQLLIEAMMFEEKAFAPLEGQIVELLYLSLTGKGEDSEETSVKIEGIAEAKANLLKLLNQFEEVSHPYQPRRALQFHGDATTYDHLSRFSEWSQGEEE